MKINKSRLLQIIREEVELHEKNIFEFDQEELEDASTEEEADINGDGEISKPEANAVIDAEARRDKITGRLRIKVKNKLTDVEEDRLFTKEKPRKIIEPKKQNDI